MQRKRRKKQKIRLVKRVVKGRIEQSVSLPKTKRSVQSRRIRMLFQLQGLTKMKILRMH